MTPHLSYKSYRLVRILLLSPAIFVQFPFKDTINDRMRGTEARIMATSPADMFRTFCSLDCFFGNHEKKMWQKRLR